VFSLLLRFWDFHEGEISLGGMDIRCFDPEHLRSKFAMVSQHTYLFNASLRENLLIAKPNATEVEICRAAQAAQLDTLIQNLPNGYGTYIGEQGMRLSGGERQRIAIARALLKDAPILILDEPTANLDPITELAVLQSIRTLMEGRSTLMVTHRLVAMDWMDEILVFQAGSIVERGTHAELLAQGGLYCRMWEMENLVLR
jgi:ATP-binding cassette subfamily C protein CydC